MDKTPLYVSNDIPVATLVRALATAGLAIRATAGGRLEVVWSPEFLSEGKTSFGHVPAFLRPVACQEAQPAVEATS